VDQLFTSTTDVTAIQTLMNNYYLYTGMVLHSVASPSRLARTFEYFDVETSFFVSLGCIECMRHSLVTDVRSVGMSVCHAAQLGFIVQNG